MKSGKIISLAGYVKEHPESGRKEKQFLRPIDRLIKIIREKNPSVSELTILCYDEFQMIENKTLLLLSELLNQKDSRYFISKNCRITTR